jgi:hypothetical protein
VIKQFKLKTLAYWSQWVKKRIRSGNPHVLDSKNIYILPSKFGCVYAVLVLSLLTGAINYQISTIYLMTFLLAVIGLFSAWETHANIKDLSIQFISMEDVQQGRPAQLILLIKSGHRKRFSLEFQIGLQPKINLDLLTINQGQQIILPVETTLRGFFPTPRVTLSSRFPFGIFCAWSYIYFDEHYYVYPQALDPGFWPLPIAQEQHISQSFLGQDEFYDLKQVENPWHEPNRIAWRIAAKGQGWYHKIMNSSHGEYWLFRLNDLKEEGLETKLQHMSYWLYEAEANNYVYSMKLADEFYEFSQGKEHLKSLLRQLALYQTPRKIDQ